MEGRQSVRRLAGATAVVLALGATIAVVAGGAAAHRSATTLTIWCWTGADGPLKSVDDGFAKAHPDIQLNYVELKPADVYQKLQLAAAAGGGFPDVSCVEDSHLAQFTKLGILADITKQAASYRKLIEP